MIMPLFVVLLVAAGSRPASAQVFSPQPGARFELADSVELNRADGPSLAQLERAKAFIADQKWDEAIETLRQTMENAEGKLIAINENRFVGLAEYCQMQLALLPPEALRLYRGQVDPLARKWYEEGVANHDPRLLRRILQQAYACSLGDDALLALGDMACESGDYPAARWYWERIIPHRTTAGQPGAWPGYPDTDLDLAAIRARLVLASVLEDSADRAREELEQFARLHGQARGRMAGQDVNYAQALGALLSESASWPSPARNFDWPTFAGSPSRTGVSPQSVDLGPVLWRVALPQIAGSAARLSSSSLSRSTDIAARQAARGACSTPSYHPVTCGDLVLVNTADEVLAFNSSDGEPAWAHSTAVIFSDQPDLSAGEPIQPSLTLGTPRFTSAVYDNKLYALVGQGITGFPQGQAPAAGQGALVCLDLGAEGRLLWKIAPEPGWALDGSPIADANGIYVAMRRIDIRPRAYVACFDAQSGRLRWRQFVISADSPARGMMFQITHNLLTLAGDTIYFNTNLGAVAALNTDDGRLLWLTRYPRQRQGDIDQPAPHWLRDLNPCIYDRGIIYAAPADSPRIFAFDAYTGMILWQTGSQTEYALDLLGATDDYLIAGGKKLYWIGLKNEDQGRIKHIWPEGNEKPGFGRGLIAGGMVLWPMREKILAFDAKTAQAKKSFDLLPRDAQGGNLLPAKFGLLIAGADELIALGNPTKSPAKKPVQMATAK
jgi:outer membrane protein assembly factor BamB